MSELKVLNICGVDCYEKDDLDLLKNKGNDVSNYMGYVYAIECGKYVKIGCTKKPYNRIRYLRRILENYGRMSIGRIAVSKPHTNYFQNERVLHEYFKKYRIESSELFEICFDDVKKEMEVGLNFENKVREKEEKESKIIEFATRFIHNGQEINLSIFESMNNEDIDKAIFMLEKYKNIREEIKMFFNEFIE